MQDQSGLNVADRELEDALRSLAPAAARMDVVGAAFEAGRRSVRTQLRLWRSAAAAAMLIGFGSWLVPVGPGFQTSHLEFAVRPSKPRVQPLAAQSVFMLEAAVREHGLAGLPPTEVPAVGFIRSDDLL